MSIINTSFLKGLNRKVYWDLSYERFKHLSMDFSFNTMIYDDVKGNLFRNNV